MLRVSLNQLTSSINRLANLKSFSTLSYLMKSESPYVQTAIKIVDEKEAKYQTKQIALYTHLQQSEKQYRRLEQNLTLFVMSGDITPFYPRYHDCGWNVKLPSYISLVGMVNNGLNVKVDGYYHYYAYRSGIESKYINGNALIGFANTSGEVKTNFKGFKDKKFDPSLEVVAGVDASLVEGSADLKVGNKYLYGLAGVKGDLISGDAKGEVALEKDHFALKGELGAAVASGEIEVGIYILGVEFTLSAQASLGSIGVSGEFEKGASEVTIGYNGALFAGGGFKLHIDY